MHLFLHTKTTIAFSVLYLELNDIQFDVLSTFFGQGSRSCVIISKGGNGGKVSGGEK